MEKNADAPAEVPECVLSNVPTIKHPGGVAANKKVAKRPHLVSEAKKDQKTPPQSIFITF